MNPLLHPIIIDKVFEYLGLLDIGQCQFVCRAWHDSALRKFKKCPATDWFRVIQESLTLLVDDGFTEKDVDEQMRELIIENRAMNGVEFNAFEDSSRDYIHYWHIGLTSVLHQLPKFKIDDEVRKFSTSSIRCVPNFSLIKYNETFADMVEGMTFGHPTVLIRKRSIFSIDLKATGDQSGNSSLLPSREKDFFQFPMIYMGTRSCFECFHISRFIPGLKIMITDWSDPLSPRPDVNDPEFPIKFVLYLATYKADYSRLMDRLQEIKMLLRQSNSVPLEGAYISSDSSISSIDDIFFVNSCQDKPRSVEEISIAFAGKEVKSATLTIKLGTGLRQSLEDFKLSLEFSIDDDRVIGFFLNHLLPSCLQKIIIREIFPCLKLVSLFALPGYKNRQNLHSSFHIIRF